MQPGSELTSLWMDADDSSEALSTPPTRRAFMEEVILKGSVGVYLASSATVAPAHASGGATAGGAYLLSGKFQ